jgi:hypothetical protein
MQREDDKPLELRLDVLLFLGEVGEPLVQPPVFFGGYGGDSSKQLPLAGEDPHGGGAIFVEQSGHLLDVAADVPQGRHAGPAEPVWGWPVRYAGVRGGGVHRGQKQEQGSACRGGSHGAVLEWWGGHLIPGVFCLFFLVMGVLFKQCLRGIGNLAFY